MAICILYNENSVPVNDNDFITPFSYLCSAYYKLDLEKNNNVESVRFHKTPINSEIKNVDTNMLKFDVPTMFIDDTVSVKTNIKRDINNDLNLYLNCGADSGMYISYILLNRSILTVNDSPYIMWESTDATSLIPFKFMISKEKLPYENNELIALTVPVEYNKEYYSPVMAVFGSDKVNIVNEMEANNK